LSKNSKTIKHRLIQFYRSKYSITAIETMVKKAAFQ
jgi:transposase-like protein